MADEAKPTPGAGFPGSLWFSGRVRSALGLAAAAAALGSVFVAYLSPSLIVDLAARVWSCF